MGCFTLAAKLLAQALRRAREVVEKARRWSCSLMRTDGEQTSDDKAAFAFMSDINTKLFERARWMGGDIDDVLADMPDELTPAVLGEASVDLCTAPC